jgi:TonB family protein
MCAADLSGSWNGRLPRAGRSDDFSLILIQDDQTVSGSFSFDRALRHPAPIERPEVRSDELTFEIHDEDGQLIRFRLRPGQAKLVGEASIGPAVSQIEMNMTVYRVGNGVSAPVLIHIEHPRSLAGVSGVVVLSIEVSPNGRAGNAKVVKTLSPEADENAIECVKQWRFRPGAKGDVPVTVLAQVEVNFRVLN